MPKGGESALLQQIILPLFAQQKYEPHSFDNDMKVQIAKGVETFDDCAVIDIGSISITLGMDYIRGTGFSLFKNNVMNHEDIGYFLAIANISDIAAMGAKPLAMLTIVRYSKDVTDAQFKQILNGIYKASCEYNSLVIGGDIGGASEVVLGAVVLGICPKGKYLLRSTASVGDYICVTGNIGRAGAARAYFEIAIKQGFRLTSEQENELAQAWKRPKARVKEGLLLNNIASACQDVSDGLKATIEQLCTASKLGAVIYEEKLPISDACEVVAKYFQISSAQLAMSASVDFELLFTIPQNKLKIAQESFGKEGLRFSIIGQTRKDCGYQFISRQQIVQSELPGIKWDHQFHDLISEITKR